MGVSFYILNVHNVLSLELDWNCLKDLPTKGTQQTPTRGNQHQAGNNQSLSYKHWFKVYD